MRKIEQTKKKLATVFSADADKASADEVTLRKQLAQHEDDLSYVTVRAPYCSSISCRHLVLIICIVLVLRSAFP